MTAAARPAVTAQRLKVQGAAAEPGERTVAEETPVAIVHDGATYAVMMATPADLEDFAVGFSLTEGVIERADEVAGLEIVENALGIELRMWLAPERGEALVARRRTMAGPAGCGLCGIESLQALQRPRRRPLDGTGAFSADDIRAAVASIDSAQTVGGQTQAVHAAGFWRRGDGLVAIREDVGRHNALDKLAGGLARSGASPAGVLVLTSRVSVELVEKAAAMGIAVLAAISAPTSLAIRTAEANEITLIAIARPDGFEVFTRPDRLELAGVRP